MENGERESLERSMTSNCRNTNQYDMCSLVRLMSTLSPPILFVSVLIMIINLLTNSFSLRLLPRILHRLTSIAVWHSDDETLEKAKRLIFLELGIMLSTSKNSCLTAIILSELADKPPISVPEEPSLEDEIEQTKMDLSVLMAGIEALEQTCWSKYDGVDDHDSTDDDSTDEEAPSVPLTR
eukprot:1194157-Prorocentrum_minimum.AAC.1